jgi:hypothetical protein
MTGVKGRRWGADVYLDPSIDIGAIPYKGANGRLLWLTPGAADQVITSNGVSPSIPSYEDQTGGGGGGSGDLVFLEEASGSAVSSLVLNSWYDAAFDHYVYVAKNIQPSSNQIISTEASTNGGSTWLTSAIYRWALGFGYPGGDGKDNGTTVGFPMRNTATPIASTEGYSHRLDFMDPGSTSLRKTMFGLVHVPASDIGIITFHFSGVIETTSAIDAIRLIPASGTITGTIRMYAYAS